MRACRQRGRRTRDLGLIIAVALITMLAGALGEQRVARADPCVITSVGVDTSDANNSGGSLLGEAPGQRFYARDTLLHSVTGWRIPQQSPGFLIGIDPYITAADSSWVPIVTQVVGLGPKLV